MSDNDPPVGDVGRGSGQALCDVLVGDAVVAVAAQAFPVIRIGQRQPLDDFVVPPVKAGIEDRDLRQIGQTRANRFDRRQLGRQVQRHHRHQRAQLGEHRVVDPDGRSVTRAAEHHAMADHHRHDTVELVAQPLQQHRHRRAGVGRLRGAQLPVGKRSSGAVGRLQMRLDADTVQLTLDRDRQPAVGECLEQLEFEARAAGVDAKNGVRHRAFPAFSFCCIK